MKTKKQRGMHDPQMRKGIHRNLDAWRRIEWSYSKCIICCWLKSDKNIINKPHMQFNPPLHYWLTTVVNFHNQNLQNHFFNIQNKKPIAKQALIIPINSLNSSYKNHIRNQKLIKEVAFYWEKMNTRYKR